MRWQTTIEGQQATIDSSKPSMRWQTRVLVAV